MTSDRSLLSRYQSGEHTDVWLDMMTLRQAVREPIHFSEANAVARETMQRVRKNVETLHQRLVDIGYKFEDPCQAHIPPTAQTLDLISEIENSIGSLPLSLRVFYEEVGSVNFMQSHKQLVHYYRPERSEVGELYILGEEDPLCVDPIEVLREEITPHMKGLRFCFAPDEFHKAYYSGGENYHVVLPSANADFYIEGMYGIEETFVEYLRKSIRFGGFRGRVSALNDRASEKVPPELIIIEQLSKDLISF